MTRADELTLSALDGEAAPAECDELARLLADDGEARRHHLALMEVECALRAGRPARVAAAVVQRLARERTRRAVDAVMSHIGASPRREQPARWRRLWPAWILLAASSAAAAIVGVRHLTHVRRPSPGDGSAAPAARRAPPLRAQTRPSPPLPAASPAATDLRPITVFAYDFEQAELPASFNQGELVEGVCPPGSRSCVVGSLNVVGRGSVSLGRNPNEPIFYYSPAQLLSFDYWLGEDAPSVEVHIFVPARDQNFGLTLDHPVRGRWAHADVRLADLHGYRWRAVRLEDGDGVTHLSVTGGVVGGLPFYVDNLRVAAYPHGATLPPTWAPSRHVGP